MPDCTREVSVVDDVPPAEHRAAARECGCLACTDGLAEGYDPRYSVARMNRRETTQATLVTHADN